MRKVVLGVATSLDGRIARPDGAVDFLFMPRDYPMAEFIAGVDVAVMGRKTYEVALAMTGGSLPAQTAETYVLSRTLPPGERGGVVITADSPATLVGRLRTRRGKDIWLMGGGELAGAFLAADLVDELSLAIVPVLIGDGIPLFPGGLPQRAFTLLEARTFSRGMVSLTYRRRRERERNDR